MKGISIKLVDHMGDDFRVFEAAKATLGGSEESQFKRGETDPTRLINFLAREKHVTPFRHPQVTFECEAPIAIARQLGKHQSGFCLTGDTEVQFVRKVKGVSDGIYSRTLEDMFKMWSGQIKYQGGKKGKRNISGSHVRVFNTHTAKFETSHITDVMYSGEKECFLITDEFGNQIKASGNHPFLTQFGWVEVKDLNKDLHCLIRKGGKGEPVADYDHRSNNSDDVIARRNYHIKRKDTHFCDKCGSVENIEVDHIIRVADGGSHDESNLQLLCHDCHVKKDVHLVDVSGGGAKYVDIKSIESIGIQPVFDISVEGHHNFIGNGFVVHNSWNERSMRYKDSVIDVFVPDMFRGRPDKLHDGSTDLDVGNNGTDFNVQEYTEDGLHLRNRSLLINELYEKAISDAVQIYETLVSSGLAPEQARFIIPQGMITRWVWTGSLYGWYSVYKQRSSEHAQYEVREFARQLDEQMSKLFPIAWQALKDSDNIK